MAALAIVHRLPLSRSLPAATSHSCRTAKSGHPPPPKAATAGPSAMSSSSDAATSSGLASLLGGAPGALRLLLGAAAGVLFGATGAVLLMQQQQAAASDDGSSAPPEQQQQQQEAPPGSQPLAATPCARDEELKMVLCVNTRLDMRKGKIGAQCAHAAVGIIDEFRNGSTEALFRRWDATGAPKVTLKVKDAQQMAELAEQAHLAGLPWYIVEDQGRTQVAAGSRTVLAIGPGYKSDVDAITGGLALL